MDGRKGISDGLEVGVVVDVGLVPHAEERVSPEKVGPTGKVKKKGLHLLVPFTVQQGMEGLSDVGILVECWLGFFG